MKLCPLHREKDVALQTMQGEAEAYGAPFVAKLS